MTNDILTRELSMPKLFFQNMETGEIHEMPNVKEIELTCNNESASEEYIKAWNYTEYFEGSFNVKRSDVNRIMIAIGLKKRIANNWLRMHGYKMNRRM